MARVKIPEQLVGSGNHLIEMHPDQYFIDKDGDAILCLRALGKTAQEIADHLNRFETVDPIPAARIETFFVLVDRKIWFQLTGECCRDDSLVKKRISTMVSLAKITA